MTQGQAITLDESNIDWKTFTTEKGHKFEVGFPTGAVQQEQTQDAALTKTDFGISVIWPVGDSSWKNTDSNTRTTAAITRYTLYQYDGFYKYMLYFTNTEHYDYYFYDETGDRYEVNTYRNGDHYVRYDSNKPEIIYIKGS